MQLFFPLKSNKYQPTKSPYYEHLPIKRIKSLKRFPVIGANKPKGEVIYFLFLEGELIYSGKSKNLARRFRRHRFNGKTFDEFAFTRLEPKYEKLFIKTYKPKANKYSKT